ncbi:hypothetical protein BH10PLA2_BH10PLA2_00500 [soil metagenome]
MDRFEAVLKPKMVSDKIEFIQAAAKRFSEFGTPNFFDLVHDHQEQVFATLKTHYRNVIPAFGMMALSAVRTKQMKSADENDLFLDLTRQWLSTEGLKRSKLIADTTEADVLAAIEAGLTEGLGTAAIASNISDVTDLSSWRSELIARTETHAAANFGSVESVRQAQSKLGVTMLKAWSPTLDSRTRPEHANMEGSDPIPMDATFTVGGEELDRPGDPAGSPENVLNCRCLLVYSEAESASNDSGNSNSSD